jgi:ABC-type phosphate/phosphonate transport system substrate-binding protein
MHLLRLFIAALAMGSLCPAGVTAATTAVPPQERPLVIGYSTKVFFEVDPRDAIGLTKVWAQAADRAIRNAMPTSVVMFRDMDDMEKAMGAKQVDIAVLIAQDYVQLRGRLPVTPVLSADFGRNFYDVLQLLVRNDSGITRIEQLRGKTIKIESGQKGSLPSKWLDTFLLNRFSSNSHGFFSLVDETAKASQAIMPLFFSKIDACLVSKDSLETLAELNPQIGRTMRILETSPGFVTGIIAVHQDSGHPRREAMLHAIRDMHQEAKGRQLLTLFRINRLIEFKAEHLVSVDKVLKDARTSVGGTSRRKR